MITSKILVELGFSYYFTNNNLEHFWIKPTKNDLFIIKQFNNTKFFAYKNKQFQTMEELKNIFFREYNEEL